MVSGWLGLSTGHHGNLYDHLQFGGLEGFSKKIRLTFNIIWISVLLVIWKAVDFDYHLFGG